MPESAGLEGLFVRLYFDRHIMTRLAVDLRGRGYEVLTTEEAGKDTAADEEKLAFATAEKRAILTFQKTKARSSVVRQGEGSRRSSQDSLRSRANPFESPSLAALPSAG